MPAEEISRYSAKRDSSYGKGKMSMFRALMACAALIVFGNPIGLAAQDKGSATVTITPAGDGLRVTIALDRAVMRLDLGEADVVRTEAIRIETPGLSLAENALVSEAPFDSVTLRLVQDLTERDAKYPPYYRVGEGHLLYAQTIYPDDAAWAVTLAIEGMPEGWTRWPEAPLPQGYLFLGPAAMVTQEGGARFIFDGNGDAAFEGEIRQSLVRALGFLEQTFGSPPLDPPFIATSILPADRLSTTGDVTDAAMIALRFSAPEGAAATIATQQGLATTRSIILHEGVHFWNGGRAGFAKDAPQWLHEGGAEYIAALGSMRLGWSSRDDLAGRVGQWLDRCATSLSYSEDVALNDLKFIPAGIRYSCGPLLHTLVELYLADRGSQTSVVDGWRETVRAAEAKDGEYDLPMFLAALGQTDLLEQPALKAILAESGAARWQTVRDEMQRMGVMTTRETSPPLRARTALMHLVRAQCTGLKPGEGYGFYSGETSYRLETPEGCGPLAGNPVIVTLAGMPLTQLGAEEYAQLQALCAAGAAVAFGLAEGSAIDVPCTSPLPDAATEPVVSALPDIAAFAAEP